MDSFSVGEIAIFVKPKNYQEYRDHEVTIIGGFQWRKFWSDRKHTKIEQGNAYKIATADGKKLIVLPYQLRKKPPEEQHREQTTTWDQCIWRPAGVNA